MPMSLFILCFDFCVSLFSVACGNGSAYNIQNGACDKCPLGYYRIVNETESCIKCNEGYTTLTTGQSICVQLSPGITVYPLTLCDEHAT